MICVQLLPVSSSGIEASGLVDVVSEAWICSYMMYTKSDKVVREREKIVYIIYGRVSNRKYESMQNQSTAVFPSRSTIGKIETVPQMGMTLKMFAPNAILNQQC